MPGYILMPFAVFLVCCVLQFWFVKKIRDRLIEKHPDTFLAIEKKAIFPHQALWKFTRGHDYKSLNDEELNLRVRNFKRLYVVAIFAWIAYAVTIFTAPIS
ncbi:hypothetical protein [uncultured Sphingomonas sp.]|uniref:hypothetical protein n=1 Tax=uncultured Sphingomonas sp. TaxID=158754 RepID=UPI0035CB0440